MLPAGANEIRTFIESLVTAVSVLGGAMAYESGLAAAKAMAENQPPEALSRRVNEALAAGFAWGRPVGIGAFILLLWT
jgi:hypothetical protein